RVVAALGTEGPLGRRVRSGSHLVLGRGARLPRARPRTSRSRESALSPSRTPFDFAGKLSNVHATGTGGVQRRSEVLISFCLPLYRPTEKNGLIKAALPSSSSPSTLGSASARMACSVSRQEVPYS